VGVLEDDLEESFEEVRGSQYLRIISAMKNCTLGFNIQSFAKIGFWKNDLPPESCGFFDSNQMFLQEVASGDPMDFDLEEMRRLTSFKTRGSLRDSVAKICCGGGILTHDQLFRSFEYLFGKLKSCQT